MNKAKMLGELFQLRMDLLDFENRVRTHVAPDLPLHQMREELKDFASHVQSIMEIVTEDLPAHE